MFSLLRLLIVAFILSLSIGIIHRSKITKKRKHIITAVVLSVILVTVSAMIPFENAFISFSSAEESYRYVNKNVDDIKLVVNGENSAFVIGDDDGSNIILIVPKTSDGWKIGMGIDTKRVIEKFVDTVVIYIYQFKDTTDYYVQVMDVNGSRLNITDSKSSDFLSIEKQSPITTIYQYYAFIRELDSDYTISINGKTIALS